MKKIIVFGASDGANNTVFCLNSELVKIIGYCDGNPDKQGGRFNGEKVYHPNQICEMDFDFIFIVSESYAEIARKLINQVGIPESKIVNGLFLHIWSVTINRIINGLEGNQSKVDVAAVGMSYMNTFLNDTRGVRKNKIHNIASPSQDLELGLYAYKKYCSMKEDVLIVNIAPYSLYHTVFRGFNRLSDEFVSDDMFIDSLIEPDVYTAVNQVDVVNKALGVDWGISLFVDVESPLSYFNSVLSSDCQLLVADKMKAKEDIICMERKDTKQLGLMSEKRMC